MLFQIAQINVYCKVVNKRNKYMKTFILSIKLFLALISCIKEIFRSTYLLKKLIILVVLRLVIIFGNN